LDRSDWNAVCASIDLVLFACLPLPADRLCTVIERVATALAPGGVLARARAA